VLQPNHIAYYESDKPNHKIRGELRVTAESTVDADVHDKKTGYHFVFSNQWESITLASSSEADRSQWILTIKSVIQHAGDSMVAYAILLYPVPPTGTSSKAAAKIDTAGIRKYFILSKNLLTYHPDAQKTSEVEGLVNLNPQTELEEVNDDQKIITLVDSDPKRTKVRMQFKAMDNAYETTSVQYQRWKTAILAIVKPPGAAVPASVDVPPLRSSLKAANKDAAEGMDRPSFIDIPRADEDEDEQLPSGSVTPGGSFVPPLPLETPPFSPVPPPPSDSPSTPSLSRQSSARKVGFALLDSDEEGEEGNRRGRSRTGTEENAVDQGGDGEKQQGTVASRNALKQAVERRKSRSLSPAVTPRKSVLAAPAPGSPGSAKPRSSSASALLKRASSFGPDLGIFRTSSAMSSVEDAAGKVPTVELFRSAGRSALSKQLFDNFSNADGLLTINALQELFYELGAYYSLMEVKIRIKPFVGGASTMDYAAFEKFYKTCETFR
jgi:hypothetical protein